MLFWALLKWTWSMWTFHNKVLCSCATVYTILKYIPEKYNCKTLLKAQWKYARELKRMFCKYVPPMSLKQYDLFPGGTKLPSIIMQLPECSFLFSWLKMSNIPTYWGNILLWMGGNGSHLPYGLPCICCVFYQLYSNSNSTGIYNWSFCSTNQNT